MKYNDLTTKQKKWFDKDSEENRKIILKALNRKPFHKVTKTGFIIDISYVYIDEDLGFDFTLLDSNKKQLWHDQLSYTEFPLYGNESMNFAISEMVELLISMIESERERTRLFKKILGI